MKPIAMRCSQEQFDEIKPILEQHGLRICDVNDFRNSEYLINNFGSVNGLITNINYGNKNRNDRTAFEEWNKDIFLEYCDIKTKPFKLLKRNT